MHLFQFWQTNNVNGIVHFEKRSNVLITGKRQIDITDKYPYNNNTYAL